MAKQMSFEKFKSSSMRSISKNVVHPSSPYDPKTMRTFHHPASISSSPSTPTTKSKTKKPMAMRKKVDKARSFVDSSDEYQSEDQDSSAPLFSPKTSTPSQNVNKELKDAKTEIDNLKQLCSKMQEQLEDLQAKSSKGGRKRKLEASIKAKRRVRKSVGDSMDVDGYCWDLSNGKGPFSGDNKKLSGHAIEKVLGLYPEMDKVEIENAIRINFRSRKDNKRKLENNPNYRADSSKNSRKDTKLNNRLKALKHLNVDDETRSAISGILVRPLMSSDDEEIDGNKKTFIVRKPCWRTEGVTNCFHTLDEARQSNLSKHSLFRLMDRKDGPPSDREEPKWSEEMVKAIKFFD